ncbi:VCBS repeat-containing protein [Patescibacteria group bacterium]|nr:VCBS repeat-containing protein [Patescibacteria group bacterium]
MSFLKDFKTEVKIIGVFVILIILVGGAFLLYINLILQQQEHTSQIETQKQLPQGEEENGPKGVSTSSLWEEEISDRNLLRERITSLFEYNVYIFSNLLLFDFDEDGKDELAFWTGGDQLVILSKSMSSQTGLAEYRIEAVAGGAGYIGILQGVNIALSSEDVNGDKRDEIVVLASHFESSLHIYEVRQGNLEEVDFKGELSYNLSGVTSWETKEPESLIVHYGEKGQETYVWKDSYFQLLETTLNVQEPDESQTKLITYLNENLSDMYESIWETKPERMCLFQEVERLRFYQENKIWIDSSQFPRHGCNILPPLIAEFQIENEAVSIDIIGVDEKRWIPEENALKQEIQILSLSDESFLRECHTNPPFPIGFKNYFCEKQ